MKNNNRSKKAWQSTEVNPEARPWNGLEILFGYGSGDEMDQNWEAMIAGAGFGC